MVIEGPMPSVGGPVVHVFAVGNIGNQMIRAMAAVRIARAVENCRLSNIELPQWGMTHPSLTSDRGPSIRFDHPRIMELPTAQPIHNLRAGNLVRVEIASYAQHMANLLPAEDYRTTFPDLAEDLPCFGDESLVINIRGSEILSGEHPDYTLVPIEFYRQLITECGLRPVFMGQLAEDPYTLELRRAFPTAAFIASRGALHDFSLIRRARRIAVSVSTFPGVPPTCPTRHGLWCHSRASTVRLSSPSSTCCHLRIHGTIFICFRSTMPYP